MTTKGKVKQAVRNLTPHAKRKTPLGGTNPKLVARLGKAEVYATVGGGFLRGKSGKVLPAEDFYATLTKGEARKLRKAAHAQGLMMHATAVRIKGVKLGPLGGLR